jgi:hypothetical protein
MLVKHRQSAWAIDCTVKAYQQWQGLVYSKHLTELLTLAVGERKFKILKSSVLYCFSY